jgi:iron complex transport system ATP-binding protein
MVEIQEVSKRYGGKTVVDQATFHIHPRKITSLIGPNGAGKSTLLSMITRLQSKDEGSIRLEGRELSSYSSGELAQKISILKQSNQVNIRLTVRELVSFGRFPYSQGRLTKKDWEHVNEAIRYMELGELEHKFLDELSGGQRQRAYIAMVLAQDTDYIFLDEPLNNLDMKHSVQIMKILRRLVDQLGKTVVLVLHDINFASCYSDRIVALKNGQVVHDGAAVDIIQSEMLEQVYDMNIHIEEICGHQICVYFAG